MTPLELYRRAIKAIWIAAQSDIKKLPESAEAYFQALPLIVETYGFAAAEAAAAFYDAMRLGAGVDDDFEAIIPDADNLGIEELVGWASAKATTPETFPKLISHGVQTRIANFARDTITESTFRDPKALGWMRIGSPNCGFCAMLISRGAVYSKRSARFASHDNCDCQAVPAFDKSQVTKVNSEFVASARRKSAKTDDADRARAKEWIAENLTQ